MNISMGSVRVIPMILIMVFVLFAGFNRWRIPVIIMMTSRRIVKGREGDRGIMMMMMMAL